MSSPDRGKPTGTIAAPSMNIPAAGGLSESHGIDRRRLLLGLGVATGALIEGGAACAASALAADGDNVAQAPVSDETQQRQPFYGVHQAGVVTPRPATGIVAAFDVLARTPADLVRLFRTLTARSPS